jgi:hypothetical protein
MSNNIGTPPYQSGSPFPPLWQKKNSFDAPSYVDCGHVVMHTYASNFFIIYLGSLQLGKQHFDVCLNVVSYNISINK